MIKLITSMILQHVSLFVQEKFIYKCLMCKWNAINITYFKFESQKSAQRMEFIEKAFLRRSLLLLLLLLKKYWLTDINEKKYKD